jgi:hypothetical protein
LVIKYKKFVHPLFIFIGLLLLLDSSCYKDRGVIVLTPKANEVVQAEMDYEILWKVEVPGPEFGASVMIEFSKDGGKSWERVDENVPNLGTYRWKVPKVDSTKCRIRLSSNVKQKYRGTSEIFTVKEIH